MFFPEGMVQVWIYGRPVDMRKSFDGLYALTRHALEENPLSGQLFVFVNRRGNFLKCLYWDRTGFCLWAKRLERGRFVSCWDGPAKRLLSWTDFKLLLEGIEQRSVVRKKRFALRACA